MTKSTSNRRRNLALGVGALLIAGAVLGRRSLTGRAAGGEGGCEGPDYREAKLGSLKQKETTIEPGQVLAGASAAIEVIKMISTYVKYGELQITNGMILDKIKAVQASIDQLNLKAETITNGQKEINANIFKSPSVPIMSAITTLFDHYTYLKSNNGDLPKFYTNLLAGNPDGIGTLNLADLDALANLGQQALPYLGDYYGGKGTIAEATAAANDLGAYAASLQLRLAEGFYLLALAKRAQGTDGDFGPQGNVVTANEKRIANLSDTFFVANDRMNELIVGRSRAARVAAISDCFNDTCFQCNLIYAFNDSLSTTVKTQFKSTLRGDPQNECISARTKAFYAASFANGVTTMQGLLAAEPTFSRWSDANNAADGGVAAEGGVAADGGVAPTGGGFPTIRVTQAKYGPGDVTPFLQSALTNRVEAAYTVDLKKLGETQPDVAKGFSVTYSCGASTLTDTKSVPAEANGKSVSVDCVRLDVAQLVGAWEYRGQGVSTAKITAVAPDTVRIALRSVPAYGPRPIPGPEMAFSLSSTSSRSVLDVGKDCIFQINECGQPAMLTFDAQGKVDSITFGPDGGPVPQKLTYRRVP